MTGATAVSSTARRRGVQAILASRVKNPPQSFVDSFGSTYTISVNGKVAVGGTEDNTTSQVVQMAKANGSTWQQNAPGNWFYKVRASDTWIPAASGPLPSGQAKRAQDFLRIIGYNAFAGVGGINTGTILKSCLDYLNSTLLRNQAYQGDAGIAYLRDNVPGIRFNFLLMLAYSSDYDGTGTSSGAIAQSPYDVAGNATNQVAQTAASFWFGAEGQNEANLFNKIGDATHPGSQAQWFAGNQGFATKIRTVSALSAVPIINMTLGNPAQNTAIYTAMGDVTTYTPPIETGTYHAYPNDGVGGGDNFFPNSSGETPCLVAVGGTNPGRPWSLTEIGYGIGGSNGSHVTGLSGGKMFINACIDAWLAGAMGIFGFELFNDTGEGLFLFDNSGNPNAMATVIHNYTTILKDTAGTALTFAPGALPFVVSGNVGGASQVRFETFQKASGAFFITAHNTAACQTTGATPSDVTPTAVNITLTFPKSVSSTATFDGTVGTTAVASTGATTTVTVVVQGFMKIIQVNP